MSIPLRVVFSSVLSPNECPPVSGGCILSRCYCILAALTGLLLVGSCATGAKSTVSGTPPLTSEFQSRLSEAEALVEKGCYVDFKRAVEVYRKLRAVAPGRRNINEPFAKALILLAVRERELGILNDAYIVEASSVIAKEPSLQFLVPYVELTTWMYPNTKGVMKDIDTMGTVQVVNRTLKNVPVSADMRLRARSDSVFAYLYATFCTQYARYLDKVEGLPASFERFRDLPLFKYKAATTYPNRNAGQLEALLTAEPEFYEADYHLGELALGIDKPLEVGGGTSDPFEAETYFVKAQAGIPESPQIAIFRAGIHLFAEEFDEAVAYFERTLALAPMYRDALLGKSICLSYMGRHQEAIRNLKNLVAMGSYLMGEGHYWLTWNYHEIGEVEAARANIDEAKSRLPTDSEVLYLAGTISLEQGQLDGAERDLAASLQVNGKNLRAVLALGRVFALKKEWADSARLYAHAALAAAQEEIAISDEIRKIESLALAAPRKARLRERKETRRRTLEETQAMSCYEAAVGYLNADQRDQAMNLAMRAAAHPALKKAASQLIEKIRLRLPVSAS